MIELLLFIIAGEIGVALYWLRPKKSLMNEDPIGPEEPAALSEPIVKQEPIVPVLREAFELWRVEGGPHAGTLVRRDSPAYKRAYDTPGQQLVRGDLIVRGIQ